MREKKLSSEIKINPNWQAKTPFLLENKSSYAIWRKRKLAEYPINIEKLIVPIKNPYQLTLQEHNNLLQCCRRTNFVIYQIAAETSIDKTALQALTQQFNLIHIDQTLCTEEGGITTLQVAAAGPSQDYIPYTDRPINWHTDGYYNAPDQQIGSVLLHCTQPALTGGDNQFFDHEIAYIKLRDENPTYIKALMQNEAMTIPANVQDGLELRPAQTGSVFSFDPASGALHMRYTARTRNIIWKDDIAVRQAVQYLTELLNTESPYLFKYRLTSNQGILCNNILHNRSGFSNGNRPEQQRLLYRIRFYDRILC